MSTQAWNDIPDDFSTRDLKFPTYGYRIEPTCRPVPSGLSVEISKSTGAVRFSPKVYCDRRMPNWWGPNDGFVYGRRV